MVRGSHPHDWIWRLTLVASTGALFGFGMLVRWFLGGVGHPSNFEFRIAACLYACIVVGASYRDERVRRKLAVACGALAYVTIGWFTVKAARTGMAHGQEVGIILLFCVYLPAFRTVPQIAAFAGYGAATLLVGTAWSGVPPVVPIPLLAAGELLVCVCFGAVYVGRGRLEQALLRSNDELEQRVDERTEDLARSLQQLREEIVARTLSQREAQQANEAFRRSVVRLESEIEIRRRAEEAAEQANRSKSTFLANMSHELRTPLNAIIGYTEIVREELDDPDARSDLEKVVTSARHLLGLIDDVLDLARIEAGRLELRFVDLPVASLVGAAMDLVAIEAASKGIALRHDLPEGLHIETDDTKLRQILVNLLFNAVKFTDRGEVDVVVRAGAPDQVIFEVIDTGIGIAPEVIPQLFQRFVQADPSSTRRRGGVGLGLALVRGLVERLGGTITVTSTVGTGSVFTVTMPRRADPRPVFPSPEVHRLPA